MNKIFIVGGCCRKIVHFKYFYMLQFKKNCICIYVCSPPCIYSLCKMINTDSIWFNLMVNEVEP